MYNVKTSNNEHKITFDDSKLSGELNGKPFSWDVLEIKKDAFHILKENKSYNVQVVKIDHKEKNVVLMVNNTKYTLDVKDKFDALLKSMGMDTAASAKVNELKAPMPGLVLNIAVAEGDTVKKGDALLVLEAMKMENNIKSPTDGIIKKINIKKGVAVEKNQVLIQFA